MKTSSWTRLPTDLALLLVTSFSLSLPLQATPLTSIATDGTRYTTSFSVVTSTTGSNNEISSAKIDQPLTIKGTITPDPRHAGKPADIFTVQRVNGRFYMRTQSGVFEPWNGQIKTLKPMQEAVNLGTSLTVEIYSGSFAAAAKYDVFIGYMPVGGNALIYTPVPAQLEIKGDEISISPLTYFVDRIETPLLQTRCIACHVSGGLATGSAFILDRSSPTSADNNFGVLRDLQKGKGSEYILQKASGSIPHTGGVQVNAGSEEYAQLATMLGLLSGNTSAATVPANDFFNGATLESRPETLRRAAIMLASRAPTQQELDLVASGDENTLRTVVRNLMAGEGFHRFLTEGTNDRLLVEGASAILNTNLGFWSKVVQKQYEIRKAGLDAGLSKQQYDLNAFRYFQTLDEGLRRSAGELVAYIAENDRPYTEVVTADYMMMTPKVAEGLDGSDLGFSNPADDFEFRPGHIRLFWSDTQFIQADPVFNTVITKLGSKQHAWAHVGVVNDLAFLTRYPTTPTNRNRARARWTMLNFLDIDIEKSAQRPTDPVALADTNNPTMNNPACTACHERMDPIAGAFRDYGLWAIYRLNGGIDSLDPNYKFPPDRSPTPYRMGDLWYRDMRSPGLLGQALTSDDTLKEAGALIAKDPAFPRASVKFWWPSVMNSPVLLAPAVSTDADYQARLTAYQAQAAAIEQFARNFRKDFNLKNLLVDMIMSPWFRTKSMDRTDKLAALEEAGVGVDKLLTPERLHRKLSQLTGHSWRETTRQQGLGWLNTGLGNTYRTLYGGIDSSNITERSRQMTPIMNVVMQNVALESACPIVLKEFMLPESARKLFAGITELDSPANSSGQARIQQKLQELFFVLHGKLYALDSPEISETFALFQQSWQDIVSSRSGGLATNKACAWTNDLHFFDGLNAPATLLTLNSSNDAVWDSTAGNAFLSTGLRDSNGTKQAWVTVLAYLLSHYDFLYE